jgi:hypothetical protein
MLVQKAETDQLSEGKAMAQQRIEVVVDVLRLPDGVEVTNCWADRKAGLLSLSASLAIMPYLNENRRAYALDFDADLPNAYFIDGCEAISGSEVDRSNDAAIFFDGDSAKTGRVILTKADDLLDMLGCAQN